MERRNFWLLLKLSFILIVFIAAFLAFGHLYERLNQAEALLRRMSAGMFSYRLELNDSLRVTSDFTVMTDIPVHVTMPITQIVNFTDTLQIYQQMRLPVQMHIKQLLPIDTTFFIPEPITIFMNDTIHINHNLRTTIGKHQLLLPVALSIPVQQHLNVAMQQIPIRSTIPINMHLNDTITTVVSMTLPLQFHIPVSFNLSQRAIIGFYQPLPITGNIPLMLQIPIHIPLWQTTLGQQLDSLADLLNITQ